MLFVVVLSPFTVPPPPPRCSPFSLNSGHVTMPLESKYFYQSSVAILSVISGLFEQMRAIPPLSQRDSDRRVFGAVVRLILSSSHVSKSIRSFNLRQAGMQTTEGGGSARSTKFTPFQWWRWRNADRSENGKNKCARFFVKISATCQCSGYHLLRVLM